MHSKDNRTRLSKTPVALIALIMMMVLPDIASAKKPSRALRKAAQKELPNIVDLGRASGDPVIRGRATAVCIRHHNKKMRALCAKEGAVDPTTEVRVATARALYETRQMKAANQIMLSLLDSPRISYQQTLLDLFRLKGKALDQASKTLIQYLTNQQSKNRASRIRDIGQSSDPFSRSILVKAALSRDEVLRSEFRYFIPMMVPETDGSTLKSLFEGGDESLKLTIIGVYDKLPSNAKLPSFFTGKVKRSRRGRRGRSKSASQGGAVSRALGMLLAEHKEPAALGHLLAVLKKTQDPNEQKVLLQAILPVMNKSASKSIRPFTDKATVQDAELRWIAWGVLMRANEKDALGRIDRWLRSDQPLKRALATRSLGNKMLEKAVPRLNGLLSDGQAPVRVAAAAALGELGRPESIDSLIDSLNVQQEPKERLVIATSLFACTPSNRYGEVSYVLHDQDANIRRVALEHFAKARNAALIPFLRQLLQDRDPLVRRLSLEGIMMSDDKEGISAFSRSLGGLEGSELIGWVQSHGEKMVPYVRKALTARRPGVRLFALDALALLPPSNRLEIAQSWVKTTDATDVRIRLLELLMNTNPSRALATVEGFAKHSDVATRSAVIRILAKSGRGLDLVKKALTDTNQTVQLEALAGILGG